MFDKDINWTEGLFVQPHHFQQAFLRIENQIGISIPDYIPHYTGVSHLKISESGCENYDLNIEEIECRFLDGTRVSFPGNALIESRPFKDLLDENRGRLPVYLGLPQFTEQEPNCLRFDQSALGGVKYRYTSKIEKVNDFVSGANAQDVEVKFLNPKILFEGESTFGYEVIPIAVVERSGQFGSVPELAGDYVPPCIAVNASPLLQQIMRETGNRLIAKNRSLRSYWKSKDTATLMKAQDAFKVQTLAMATNSFQQFTSTKRIHPFHIYMKMAEIVGMLSIYCEDDRFVEVPVYDHNDLGTCFLKAQECLNKLLALLEEITYEARVFEIGTETLDVIWDPRWFEDKYEQYICFEARLDESEVGQRVTGLKVAPQNIIPVLNQRRIRGMSLEGPVHHLTHLPTSPHHHYFKVPRQHTLYGKLKENPTLSIWGNHQFAEVVTLYIVEKK